MQQEFHRTPTLDEISAKAHLSPFHFHRRFTELLGREGDALRLKYAAGDRGDAPVAMQVEVRRSAEFATPYSPTHQLGEARRDSTLRLTVKALGLPGLPGTAATAPDMSEFFRP